MGIILIKLFIWDVFGCMWGQDEVGERYDAWVLIFVVGGIGDGIKMYLGFITLIKHYSSVFTAIEGRDGMDVGG